MNRTSRKYSAVESIQQDREEKLRQLAEKHKLRAADLSAQNDALSADLQAQRDDAQASKRRENDALRTRDETQTRLDGAAAAHRDHLAAEAKRYQALQARHGAVEAALKAAAHDREAAAARALDEASKRAGDDLAAAAAENSSLTTRIEELQLAASTAARLRGTQTQAHYDALEGAAVSARRSLEELRGELLAKCDAADDRADGLQAHLDAQLSEVAYYNEEIDAARVREAALERGNASAEARAVAAEARCTSLEARLNDAASSSGALEKSLAEENRRYDAENARLAGKLVEDRLKSEAQTSDQSREAQEAASRLTAQFTDEKSQLEAHFAAERSRLQARAHAAQMHLAVAQATLGTRVAALEAANAASVEACDSARASNVEQRRATDEALRQRNAAVAEAAAHAAAATRLRGELGVRRVRLVLEQKRLETERNHQATTAESAARADDARAYHQSQQHGREVADLRRKLDAQASQGRAATEAVKRLEDRRQIEEGRRQTIEAAQARAAQQSSTTHEAVTAALRSRTAAAAHRATFALAKAQTATLATLDVAATLERVGVKVLVPCGLCDDAEAFVLTAAAFRTKAGEETPHAAVARACRSLARAVADDDVERALRLMTRSAAEFRASVEAGEALHHAGARPPSEATASDGPPPDPVLFENVPAPAAVPSGVIK
ncbi:hypothetical protein M885DRAFT_612101 [Pelagophyceae sp. CCMP2097]|nr:hypothetical protein M885DRAFT_612101 [Pelagophyceae sp. CCMP2097]